MIILTLCREDNLCKELWGFARAFRRHGVTLACVAPDTPLNVDVRELLAKSPAKPDLILQPDSDYYCLPSGLTEIEIPTVCFHFDTYSNTSRRVRWSTLFDIPVVFHPGFEDQYRLAGHAFPLTLAHAAQLDFYADECRDKTYEVGWVGRMHGAPYGTRERLLPQLAREFRMNRWDTYHTLEETADVHRHSKIVVNIGRDDYPQDANMRVFETMAAGALLLTRLPTNLASLGFVDGEHFIGFREESQVIALVRRYLADESARARIARAARQLVLQHHTYDARVKSLLDFVGEHGPQLAAPARRWPKGKVRLTYLDYYAATFSMNCAYDEFRWLGRHSPLDAASAAPLIGRSWARRSLNWMQTMTHGAGG